MTSLKLDPNTWDLTLDTNNNIATVSGDDAVAQDAACAARLYLGELWYDTTQGVDWKRILDRLPALTLMKALILAQVNNTVGVVRSNVFFSSLVNRVLSGQIQTTTGSGKTTPSNLKVGG